VPRFLVEPESQIVKPGSAAVLTCAVAPSAETSVRWLFNGRSLTEHRRAGARSHDSGGDAVLRRLGLSARLSRNKHSLHVASFDMARQEGVYQCVATTSAGSLLSRPATLEPAGTVLLLYFIGYSDVFASMKGNSCTFQIVPGTVHLHTWLMTAAWSTAAGTVLDRRRQRPNWRTHQPERRSATDPLLSTDYVSKTVYRRPPATHHSLSLLTDSRHICLSNSCSVCDLEWTPLNVWTPILWWWLFFFSHFVYFFYSFYFQ